MNKKNKKFKGFTLIEVLLAIFILEIGLLGIAFFYTYALKVTRAARYETMAANLAAGLIDQELAKTYDNLIVQNGTREHYSADQADPFYFYEKKVDISFIDSNLATQTTETHLKKILITIYWNDQQEKSFQISSIKSQD